MQTITINMGDESAVTHVQTACFGAVPKAMIGNVTKDQLNQLRTEIFERTSRRDIDEQFLQLVDKLRTAMGAFYLGLRQQIMDDTEEAERIADSLWKAMHCCLLSKKFKILKYRGLFETGSGFYQGRKMFLANLPEKEALAKRWGRSWDEHVQLLWGTGNEMAEAEGTYRNAAIVVAQIGVGIGGMVVGIVGLALSVLALLVQRGQ